MKNLKRIDEAVGSIEERRASAESLLKMVAKGDSTDVEGIKLSKEMADAFLDWLRFSTYGKKFGALPFYKLFTAAFNWGLDRYAKGDAVMKKEFKDLKSKASEMRKSEKFESNKLTEDHDLSEKVKGWNDVARVMDAGLKKAIKSGSVTLRYAKDYVKSLERMATRNTKKFFDEYGNFSEDDFIEDVEYNMANESKVNEAKFSFSEDQVKDVAEVIAKAIEKMDNMKTAVHDMEYDAGRGAGFEISMGGDKYEGGSYVVRPNGEVYNAAIGNAFPNAVYAKIGDTDIRKVMKNIKKFESVEVNEAKGKKLVSDLYKMDAQVDYLSDADDKTKKIWKKAGINPEDNNQIILYSYVNSWPETKKLLDKSKIKYKELEDPNSSGESFIVFNVNESKEDFKPHMMYDPETGEEYKAEKPEDHERMAKLGYVHEKPEKVDEARFVKSYDTKVNSAETEKEVKKIYPKYKKVGVGKLTHFFGELESNLFFKAYYAKTYKQDTGKSIKGDFKITSVYSFRNGNGVELMKESIMENFKTYSEFVSENYDTEQRKEMAAKGFALSDGSFPIANLEDLKNAIQAYGRAKDQAKAAKFIAKRAKALGAEDLIPDSDDFQKSLDEVYTQVPAKTIAISEGKADKIAQEYDAEEIGQLDMDDMMNAKEIEKLVKSKKFKYIINGDFINDNGQSFNDLKAKLQKAKVHFIELAGEEILF